MNKLLVLSLLATLGACSSKQGEVVADGAENYERYCAGCHNPGPGHGATMLLAEKGRPVPALIGRKDLDYDYLHSVVRQGLIEMPPFRATELSDPQIKEVYEYIKTAEPPKQEPALPKS
ncbi:MULTISPECIES: cytochrome c [Novosphingobium]|jgi:mono/diheme cytochrome c family protein|uniref:Cytochrome c n=2 Tax=Novosphingobium TaxID=165696 RepID=A0A7Y0BR54_9SPHN|nr:MULTISPECIES: cytochrome c [Novosphingobium]NML95070.1 cytochrome c [Novosphingobium olei]PKB13615.1 cbb3-type cytochrome c oxidase subunit III [Novosphingobium kunmingense]QOV96741.1 cytochrome c [Novosphingobium sp. ES2-1]